MAGFHASFNRDTEPRLDMGRLGFAGPPESPQPTASSFAQWVFEVTTPGFRRGRRRDKQTVERSLLEGRFIHRGIEALALWYNRDHPGSLRPSSWRLEYADPHDDAASGRVFCASRLTVAGQAMRCSPDVVFKHRRTGAVLIVERKTTRARGPQVPLAGWPRIAAQLWCYGWIDDWADAPEAYLVGQIWTRRSRGPGHFQVTWAKPRWRRSDAEFHATWCRMFGAFGGRVTGHYLNSE